FDPRSEGESTKTTTGNTPEVRAQDLHTSLERLGVRRPVLIGWSQGVQDIAAYVEHYGTKELAGIVLVDAAVSDGADGMVARPQETAAQFKMFAIYQPYPSIASLGHFFKSSLPEARTAIASTRWICFGIH